ncbi:hypothetical protein DFH28DRAFT_958770 [Melampsora americana]|nr:hypothetical protein DFH28DRAFT_958770 [Melampsora americana]
MFLGSRILIQKIHSLFFLFWKKKKIKNPNRFSENLMIDHHIFFYTYLYFLISFLLLPVLSFFLISFRKQVSINKLTLIHTSFTFTFTKIICVFCFCFI